MAKSGPRKPRTNPEEAKGGLIDAAIVVLARDGFARTSARSVAAEAGGTNGLIFYHFGSMDGLLSETAAVLSNRRMTRVKEALGGADAAHLWPDRLANAIRSEAVNAEGLAVVELLIGARTSTTLSQPVNDAITRSIDFAAEELHTILDGTPWLQVVPVDLIAEVATAAFFGLELFSQAGREVDIDRLAKTAAFGIQMLLKLPANEVVVHDHSGDSPNSADSQ